MTGAEHYLRGEAALYQARQREQAADNTEGDMAAQTCAQIATAEFLAAHAAAVLAGPHRDPGADWLKAHPESENL